MENLITVVTDDTMRQKKYRNYEVLKSNDNEMRDNFYFLVKIDGRYYVENRGNVGPSNLGDYYREISKKKSDEILKIEDNECFERKVGFLCAEGEWNFEHPGEKCYG